MIRTAVRTPSEHELLLAVGAAMSRLGVAQVYAHPEVELHFADQRVILTPGLNALADEGFLEASVDENFETTFGLSVEGFDALAAIPCRSCKRPSDAYWAWIERHMVCLHCGSHLL